MADPVATVEKIVKIGLKIKAAVDTVRHNEEDCNEIRRRVLRFSAILSQLQQTGMMNDSPAMSGALEDLEETLERALELVEACQERTTIRRLVAAGDLSKQLRRVKDDILNKVMLASFAINAHTTIILLTIQAGGQNPLPQQPEDAALKSVKDNIDIRLTLSSLLIDEGRTDEAVILLSPPKSPELQSANPPDQNKPWWCDGKVKMQLANIYYSKGELENFVNTIFHPILETLNIEYANRKVRSTKKLPITVLHERVKVLGEQRPDSIFQGLRPIASPVEIQKANRAKKLMEKRAASNEELKPDGLERRTKQVPPVPGLLTNVEHHQLVLNLCRTLALLQRYWDALQIINRTLKLGNDALTYDNKEELRSLGAQIAYRAPDPRHGFKYVRYVVQQHPYSLPAWNSYYKVTSRIEDRFPHHFKYILRTREEKPDCVPPIIISGHRFTAISQHQSAARDYLEAYKLDPENPLINLCVGTALICLALGFRLQNKNQCIVQAFAFLYRYLRLCDNSQEALYNIARAYHHIGLNTLAAVYYEKALATEEKDHPIPKLPYEAGSHAQEDKRPGYCDVRREAAFNLHLIYKKSGATDLARRILKTYCTV